MRSHSQSRASIKNKQMKIIISSLLLSILFLTCANAQLNLVKTGEYYENIDTNLRKEALKDELYNLIKGHTDKGYTFVKTIFLESDEDPGNSDNLVLVYTGRSITKTTDYSSLLNREHTWAKSHGDLGTSGPGSDAHNLKPADQSVNSSRGNKDFDWGTTTHSEATECKYTTDSWEPRDAVKGDIARIMFYMATRYEGENGEPDLELVDYIPTSGSYFGKLSTLVDWHNSDTVDAFERNRNEVIYSYQNNRNPYIDNPQWVNQIWGADTIVDTLSIDTIVIDTITIDTIDVDTITIDTLTADTLTVDTISSYLFNSFKGFSIYPNPANSYLHIVFPESLTFICVNVFDRSGKLMFTQKRYRHSDYINVEMLNVGLYMVQVLSGNASFICKFIRE